MKLLITSDSSDNVFSLEVGDDMELSILKALCESECGIPSDQMVLLHNGRPLEGDTRDIKHFGLKDGDIVLAQRRRRTPPVRSSEAPSTSRGPSEDDPATIRAMFRANPDQLALLRQSNPRLAQALESGNDAEFDRLLKAQIQARKEEEQRRIRMLTADPFDPEAQRMIAEEIRRKNVDANMEQALEHNPESFGTVVMLYIDCVVNNHHVKAFVDSGAQTTLMSAACAERCGIKRLIDTRWSGIAKGVGTQRITGRVHMAQIQIADCFLATSFSILEDQPMDMLLGLDMLKRHQCIIDLKRNVLIIGTTGKETAFLPESQLPPCARLTGGAEETDTDMELAKALEESAASATASSTAALLPSDQFGEKEVSEVMKAGATREEAFAALRNAKGDLNSALVAVLTKSLAAPKK